MRSLLRFSVRRFTFITLVLAGTIGCDQSTKILARDVLPTTGALTYAGGTVLFEHAQNPGAFLSFGAQLDEGPRFWIFSVFTAVFLLVMTLILFGRRDLHASTVLALALIVGGGLGNLIDRLIFGSVTDFMIVGVGPLRTGIFNVADMAIVAGSVLILFGSRRTPALK